MIEKSLRRDLGVDELAEIRAKVAPAAGEKGMELATDELRAMRGERRGEGNS